MSEENKPSRMLFIDNLRILLTILVIMHHTMITYGASGGWIFKDPHTDEFTSTLLSIIALFDQAFFMGLFFFISTYFIPGSYNRKGAIKFLKERFIRLGIPIVIFVVTVQPIMVYLVIIRPQSNMSFLEYYFLYFQSLSFLNGNGPLWFIVALLIFAIFYCFWRQISKKDPGEETEQKPPSNLQIVLIIVIMSVLTVLMRLWFPMDGGDVILNIQLGFVVQYIIMLILGVIAYERGWFSNIPDSQGKLWLLIALISFPIIVVVGILIGAFEDPSIIQSGLTWQPLVFSFWESTFCIGMSIGLITLFRRKLNTQGKASKTVSPNAYTMYLIHAPILVGISVLLVGILIPALLKFVIVLFIVLLLCFLISHFILRRIPGTKRILG